MAYLFSGRIKSEPVLADTSFFLLLLLSWFFAFKNGAMSRARKKSQRGDKMLEGDERGVKEKKSRGNNRKRKFKKKKEE